MMPDFINILILKSNIHKEFDKQRILSTLDAYDSIEQWNIDLHDVDCVLRIVSDSLTPEQIISVIKHNGFECAELE